VGAVLAWLPTRLPADALRRLQLAAQLHEGPVFLLRAAEGRSRASAAPLRLLLSAWGPDLLRVSIVKRRGSPLAEPLLLELPPVLSAPALARALRGPARGAAWAEEGAATAAAAEAAACTDEATVHAQGFGAPRHLPGGACPPATPRRFTL
jgi:protein ImuA